jgi:hypothetical protein
VIYRLADKAGGVAVFDPEAWFGQMSVRAVVGWLEFYAVEPWGNREQGIRTGMLALATGMEKGSAEDFIVSTPTKAEERERRQWEEQVAGFNSWVRG